MKHIYKEPDNAIENNFDEFKPVGKRIKKNNVMANFISWLGKNALLIKIIVIFVLSYFFILVLHRSDLNYLSTLMTGFVLMIMIYTLIKTRGQSLTNNQETTVNHNIEESEQVKQLTKYIKKAHEVIVETIPVLHRNIEYSRGHTEDEVSALSERFSNMAEQISQLEKTLSLNDHQQINNLLDSSEKALGEVITQLGSLNEPEKMMIDEIKNLSTHTSELDAMAKIVKKVSEDINLLALNASIEAARAGSYGRGFAVVALEVRQLAKSSADAGSQMSQIVEKINSSMTNALSTAELAMNSDKENLDSSGLAISRVLKDIELTLTAMKENADVLNQNNQQIQLELNAAIVSMQFQDRVCQALSHVEDNLNYLRGIFMELNHLSPSDRTDESINLEEILSQIESSYTTPDELSRHKTHNSKAQISNSDSAGLTFF